VSLKAAGSQAYFLKPQHSSFSTDFMVTLELPLTSQVCCDWINPDEPHLFLSTNVGALFQQSFRVSAAAISFCQ